MSEKLVNVYDSVWVKLSKVLSVAALESKSSKYEVILTTETVKWSWEFETEEEANKVANEIAKTINNALENKDA